MKNNKCEWFYSEKVKEHFFHPKNIMTDSQIKKYKADGVGTVGSSACGDVMRMWIKVDKKNSKIKECKWQCFGCASAIATTSILSQMVRGLSLEKAKKITPMDIVKKLGGLPSQKIHCSVLGDQALRAAIKDYEVKNESKKTK
jgi:NifU-like protein involved in Fe-S cluster formation